MIKGKSLAIILLLLIFSSAVLFVLFGKKKDDYFGAVTPDDRSASVEKQAEDTPDVVPSQVFTDGTLPEDTEDITVITYKDGRYEPDTVHISIGDRVLWINESDIFWPATDIHPTHKQYPGSNIIKCSSDERALIFDACDALGPGADYSFTFNQVGEWQYHDHIDPRAVGTVVVSP